MQPKQTEVGREGDETGRRRRKWGQEVEEGEEERVERNERGKQMEEGRREG